MKLPEFDRFCGSLPATEMVIQWGGAHVWKVGGKVFAIASLWGAATTDFKVGFKTSDLAFQMLCEEPDIQPSPYLGRYKWVQLQHAERHQPMQLTTIPVWYEQGHSFRPHPPQARTHNNNPPVHSDCSWHSTLQPN